MRVRVATALSLCAMLLEACAIPSLPGGFRTSNTQVESVPLPEFLATFQGEWYGLAIPMAGSIGGRRLAMTFPSASLSIRDDVVIKIEGRCEHRLVPVADQVTASYRTVDFGYATDGESCLGTDIVSVTFTPDGQVYPPMGVNVRLLRETIPQVVFAGARPTEPAAARQQIILSAGQGHYFAYRDGRDGLDLAAPSRNELIGRAMNTLDTRGWTCLSQTRGQLLPGDRLRFEVVFNQEDLGFLVECEGDCPNLIFGMAPEGSAQPLRYDGIIYGFPFVVVPSNTFFTKRLLIWAEHGHGTSAGSRTTSSVASVRITKWTTEWGVTGPGCSSPPAGRGRQGSTGPRTDLRTATRPDSHPVE